MRVVSLWYNIDNIALYRHMFRYLVNCDRFSVFYSSGYSLLVKSKRGLANGSLLYLDDELRLIPQCVHLRVAMPFHVGVNPLQVISPNHLRNYRSHLNPGKASQAISMEPILYHLQKF